MLSFTRFLNLALEVAERLPEKVLKICETLIAKSDIFIKTGDFQSAKQVLRKAYKLKSTNKDDRETVEKRLRVGKTLFLQIKFPSNLTAHIYSGSYVLY